MALRSRRSRRAASTPDPQKTWEPIALRPTAVSLVVIAHAILLVTIVALVAATHSMNGFVEVQDGQDLSLLFRTFGTDLSFLWTALPPFILQLFLMCRNWLPDEATVREPFAQLGSGARVPADGKGNGQLSVLRDYRSTIYAIRWIATARDGHWHLSFGLLLSLIGNLLLVPLVASMIHVQDVTSVKGIFATHSVEFNESFAFAPVAEWGMILDAVTSEVLYGGRHISWTNKSHAFQPYEPMVKLPGQAQVTAPSKAYSAHLDCAVVPPQNYFFDYDRKSGTDNLALVRLNATDRGCTIKHTFPIFGALPLKEKKATFEAGIEITCSNAANRTRMFFIGATSVGDSQPELETMNVISCITSYGATPGNLTVQWLNYTSSTPPTFVDFKATDRTYISKNEDNDRFEYGILTTTLLQGASETEFGNLVVQSALKLLPTEVASRGDPMRAIVTNLDILMQAIPQTFSFVYRAAISEIGFQPVQQSENALPVQATLEAPQTRLFVRYWVAAITLVFLLLSLVSTAWLVILRVRRPLSLKEEPDGLMSYIGLLLYNTDDMVAKMVRDVTSADDFDGKFVETAKKKWMVEEATFSIVGNGFDGNIALRAENLRPYYDEDEVQEEEEQHESKDRVAELPRYTEEAVEQNDVRALKEKNDSIRQRIDRMDTATTLAEDGIYPERTR
jgi:hypothetical protein